MNRIILCLLIIISIEVFSIDEGFIPVNKKEKIQQGEISLKTASEYLEDRKYYLCIDKIKEFQILFHDHPSYSKSHRILSSAFEKISRWDKVAQTELNLYKEKPETEEGLTAFLNAGKAYIRIGKTNEAKRIFEFLISRENTLKITKDAELELKLLDN